MALGLTDPLTALSFSAMPIPELVEYHRELVAAQREIHHWRRLLLARIDLAVAAVTDVEDPLGPPAGNGYGCPVTPPPGLRELLGISGREQRLRETALLMELRCALSDIKTYTETLDAVTEEAAHILAYRIGSVA